MMHNRLITAVSFCSDILEKIFPGNMKRSISSTTKNYSELGVQNSVITKRPLSDNGVQCASDIITKPLATIPLE